MLFEFRSYQFGVGDALRYLDLLAGEGLPIVTGHLPFLGMWIAESGTLNMLYHLWVYESLQDRAKRRASLMADERWTHGFVPKAFHLIGSQHSSLAVSENEPDWLGTAIARSGQVIRMQQTLFREPPGGWFLLSRLAFGQEPPSENEAVLRIVAGGRASERIVLTKASDLDIAEFESRDLLNIANFGPIATSCQ